MAAKNTLKLAFILSATDKMSRVVDEAVKKSTDKLSAFERRTGKVSRSMMKAGTMMVGAGAAVGAAMYGVAKSTANYGDEVLKTSQRVGVGVEEWQRMAYAAKFSNVENNLLAETFSKLNKRVSDAAGGNKAYMQTFTDLGIKVKDVEGKLRSPIDIFTDLAEVFDNVEDGPLKTALAMELFGETGSKLIPLLNTGRNGLKALGDEASKMGNIIGQDAALASEKFNDDIRTLGMSLAGLKIQLGTALIPVLSELITKINSEIDRVTAWAKENPKLMGTIAKVGMTLAGLLVTVGSASLMIGGLTFAVGKASAAFKTISTIAKSLKLVAAFNPLILIIVAIVAAAALLIMHWDKVSAFFKKLWDNIKNIFTRAWQFLKKLFLNYTPTGLIIKHWDKIAGWFKNLWDKVKEPFIQTWQFIKNLFLNYTPTGLIIKHWDKIVGFFVNLWSRVKEVFVNLGDNLGGFFVGLKDRFFEWGGNIIQGLIDGVMNFANKAIDAVKNVGKKIANGFKSIFGINSPSRVFAEYGMNITQGLVVGVDRGGADVENATEGMAAHATKGISQSLQSSSIVDSSSIVNGVYSGASLTYAPQITINGEVTSQVKEDFSKMLKQHTNDIVSIIRRDAENSARLSFNT